MARHSFTVRAFGIGESWMGGRISVSISSSGNHIQLFSPIRWKFNLCSSNQ